MPEYLDTPALAARTHISESSLEKMRWRGNGPPFLKLGRKVLYRVSDVDTWLAKHVRTNTSAAA
jgi:predicted DNA-binding transcriptional regulator AlpA